MEGLLNGKSTHLISKAFKYGCGILWSLLFNLVARSQIISWHHEKEGLALSYKKTLRLQGGIGVIGAKEQRFKIQKSISNNVALLSLRNEQVEIGADEFAGVLFDDIPSLKLGVTLWRYKPWNSWTKPIALTQATKMEAWDVQFFYWQYGDGLYGAAVPLSGNGFRTTREHYDSNAISIRLYEGGTFRGYSKTAPKLVTVNGKKTPFKFRNNLLDVLVPASIKPLVTIRW